MIKNRGFTLVELMVAISIVAILSTIGVAAFRSVLRDSRNAKRQTDLRTIQSALEQYHNDQRFYPAALPAGGSALTNLIGRVSPSPAPALKTYLNSLPSDPQTSAYVYQSFPNSPTVCTNEANGTNLCNRYCLYARLENATPMPIASPCTYPATYNHWMTSP